VRTALDTNIPACAEGINGPERAGQVRTLLSASSGSDIVVPVQALAELFNVLTRKAKWPAKNAKAAVESWHDAYATVDMTLPLLYEAMEITLAHHFTWWDSVMIAAASQSGCRFLLSEDMHAGFAWRGVEIRNPFI
jgi:predicted nucleic acid-binding protein